MNLLLKNKFLLKFIYFWWLALTSLEEVKSDDSS
jgi:hypothetical protein